MDPQGTVGTPDLRSAGSLGTATERRGASKRISHAERGNQLKIKETGQVFSTLAREHPLVHPAVRSGDRDRRVPGPARSFSSDRLVAVRPGGGPVLGQPGRPAAGLRLEPLLELLRTTILPLAGAAGLPAGLSLVEFAAALNRPDPGGRLAAGLVAS